MRRRRDDQRAGLLVGLVATLAGWWGRLRGKNADRKHTRRASQDHPRRDARHDPLRAAARHTGAEQARSERERFHEGSGMTLETICSYLDDEGFGYAASSSGGAVQTGFRGKHGLYSVLMTLTGDPLCFVVHVRLPLVVPDDRRADVCETVVRANHGLLIGGFDFHISEGLLLYRAAAPVADADLTREQFRQFLFACLILADRYARAFQRLLFADDLSPAEVIAEVEMD